MDLVPHIPHLNGLQLDDFLTMHIDPEPSAEPSAPQLNGHTPKAFVTNINGIEAPNGHGYPRPSTYF